MVINNAEKPSRSWQYWCRSLALRGWQPVPTVCWRQLPPLPALPAQAVTQPEVVHKLINPPKHGGSGRACSLRMAADSQRQTSALAGRGRRSSRRPRADYRAMIAALLAGENEHPNPDTPPASGGGQRKRRAPEVSDMQLLSEAPCTIIDCEPTEVPLARQQQQRQQEVAGASLQPSKRQRGAADAAVAAILQAAEADSDSDDEDHQSERGVAADSPSQANRATAAGTVAPRQRKRRTRVLVDVHGGAGPGTAAAAAAGKAGELRPEDVENEYERQVGWWWDIQGVLWALGCAVFQRLHYHAGGYVLVLGALLALLGPSASTIQLLFIHRAPAARLPAPPQRLERIRRNEQMLRNLGVAEAAGGLTAAVHAEQRQQAAPGSSAGGVPRSRPAPRERRPTLPAAALPVRKSKRQRGERPLAVEEAVAEAVAELGPGGAADPPGPAEMDPGEKQRCRIAGSRGCAPCGLLAQSGGGVAASTVAPALRACCTTGVPPALHSAWSGLPGLPACRGQRPAGPGHILPAHRAGHQRRGAHRCAVVPIPPRHLQPLQAARAPPHPHPPPTHTTTTTTGPPTPTPQTPTLTPHLG